MNDRLTGRPIVITRYLGATDTRGSRIVANADFGSKMVPYDHRLDTADNHLAAARALVDEYAREGVLIGSAFPAPRREYAFALAGRDDIDAMHGPAAAIAELLSGYGWNAETLESIAIVLRDAGYTIAEPND